MWPSDDAYAPLTAGLPAARPDTRAPGDRARGSGLRRRWQGAIVALLSGATIFGACQGDNLWSGNSESLQPRIVGIAVPNVVYAGDTLTVQVSAYGARQIASVELSLAGAASFDTATQVTPAPNVSQTFKIPLPYVMNDTSLIVRATAHDKVGAVSRVRADTVLADAPPMVVAYAGPDSVREGVPMHVVLRAVGVRGVSKVRLWLSRASTRYDSILVVPPRSEVVDSLPFVFAAGELGDTLLGLDMQAVDRAGMAGFHTFGTLPVARSGPVVQSVLLETPVVAGTFLSMTVHAKGPRKIARLNYRLSGGTTRDRTVTVSNPASDLIQTDTLFLPGDARDTVHLSVRATDVGGLTGPARDTALFVPSDLPVVDSVRIQQGGSVVPGGRLDATVFAHGSRLITHIDLALRQAFDADYGFRPTPRTVVNHLFNVTLPDSSKDSVLVVTAMVRDTGDQLSLPYSIQLKVTDNTAPTITAALTSSSVAAGAAVGVRLSARDNVGLSIVGARLFNAALLQVGGDSMVTTGKARDTTLLVGTPLGPPANMSVVAFARDLSNREGKTQAMPLALVDSSLPAVTIINPAEGMTFPLHDSIPVTVRASSLIGVRSIEFKGVAIRGDSLTSSTVVTRYNLKTVSFPQPPSLQMPRDTSITRYLTATADTTSEAVKIVATVTDSMNKKGVDTVTISVGGPRVQILTPVNGSGAVGVGVPFQLRIMAKDRSVGVDSITALLAGVATDVDSIKWRFNAVDSVTVDTTVTIQVAGSITINVSAWNHNHIIGRAIPVVVTAATGGASDQQRPSIAISSIQALTRTELTDPIRVAIHAQDNGTAGLVRFGIVAVIARPAGFSASKVDTVALATPVMAPRSGWIDTVFTFVPRQFRLSEDSTVLPASLSMRVTAFAQDGGGFCGATASAAADSLPCQWVPISTRPDSFYVPQGANPAGTNLTLVGGRSVGLPGGGTIADAAVDSAHRQVYLSNIGANRVDVLKLTDTTFVSSAGGVGLVGSQPWGLFLNGTGDTLFVGNSGSTNISFLVVDGGPNNLREDVARRLLTPNEVLFEVNMRVSNGYARYTTSYYDFSDRPQFVAQDVMGRLVYSTKPTGTAPDGTLRYVIPRPPQDTLEPKLLFNLKAIDTNASDITAIAFIDSVRVYSYGTADDSVAMWDHVPGHPGNIIGTPTRMTLGNAIAYLKANGSDIEAYAGKWKVDMIGMSDTTFMAAARTRGKIAFGEGAAAPAGRIMVWDGTRPIGQESLSNDVAVQDLLNNASERVFGLGMNFDGSLGVARGAQGAYFFTPDLRLQGEFTTPGGAGGAAMHPAHVDPRDTTRALAFVSTPNKTIKILHAVHFFQRGEIALRDNVVGPVKAALPLAGENGALAPTDPNFILVKLYAVTGYTDAGGYHTQVVILNVRNKDLTN